MNGEKWFGLREKEYLRKLIWQVAEFSGVRVITYAVMDNHFHVLAEVPPERAVSDEEIVRRFAVLYPEKLPGSLSQTRPWPNCSPKTRSGGRS